MRNHRKSFKLFDSTLANTATRVLAAEVLMGLGCSIDDVQSSLRGSFVSVDTDADVETFQRQYAASEFLSKSDFLDVDIDREAVAIEKFLDTEVKCRETNHRLLSALSPNQALAPLILKARGKIRRCLGPFNWDSAEKHFGFGPGASIGVKRSMSDLYYKFGTKSPTCTTGCSLLAQIAISRIPSWYYQGEGFSPGASPAIEIVAGNKVTTVPKSYKTDRVIATEPLMNMFIQKGIGNLIRRRLKYVGVNLDSQVFNQACAWRASVDGGLATLDLSSASDSISMELVRVLLPPDWVDALEACRSPRGTLPSGRSITYEKWSSMGNGYTFELESLIFWALCSSAISSVRDGSYVLAVYGDDLVVPLETASLCVELLSFCGFAVNAKKSHVGGWFHESCGKHYFRGVDVTPIYLKRQIDSDSRLFWFANSIRILASRLGRDVYSHPDLKPAYMLAVSTLHPSLQRNFVPVESGHGGLWETADLACPKRVGGQQEGWKYHQLLPRVRSRVVDGPSLLAKALFIGSSEDGLRVESLPIDKGGTWVVKKARSYKWSEPAPWL